MSEGLPEAITVGAVAFVAVLIALDGLPGYIDFITAPIAILTGLAVIYLLATGT